MQLENIQTKIYEIRGLKVMLDFDLAELYEVQTKVLNQAVKRNIKRFPDDFMFQITRDEYNSLRSQIVTLETGRAREVYQVSALRFYRTRRVDAQRYPNLR